MRLELDSIALQCLGTVGFAACPISLLTIRLGHVPSARICKDQVLWWMKFWHEVDDTMRADVTTVWGHKRDFLGALDPSLRWQHANGGISATIITLLEVGWVPCRPGLWFMSSGSSLAILDHQPHSNSSILTVFEEDYNRSQWASASSHFGGHGLQEGVPSFAGLKKAKRKCCKEGWLDLSYSCDLVAAGGAPLGSRMALNSVCRRCSLGVIDSFIHRYFECPHNCGPSAHALPWIHSTSWVIAKGRACDFTPNCLWSRGMLPWSMSGSLVPPPVSLQSGVLGEQNLSDCSYHLFTDGSGGPRWVHPTLSQAGAGSVSLGFFGGVHEPECLASVGFLRSSTLGRQSVPRSELSSPLSWLDFVRSAGVQQCNHQSWHSDALYVTRGADPDINLIGRSHLESASNGDLWSPLYQALSAGSLPSPSKVQGHATIAQVTQGEVSWLEYWGNGIADILAGQAAEALIPPSPLFQQLERNETLVFCLTMRLASVEVLCKSFLQELDQVSWEIPAAIPIPSIPQAASQLLRAWNFNGHRLARVFTGSGLLRIRCSGCGLSKSRSNIRFWSRKPCQDLDWSVPSDPVSPVGPKTPSDEFTGNFTQNSRKPKLQGARSEQRTALRFRELIILLFRLLSKHYKFSPPSQSRARLLAMLPRGLSFLIPVITCIMGAGLCFVTTVDMLLVAIANHPCSGTAPSTARRAAPVEGTLCRKVILPIAIVLVGSIGPTADLRRLSLKWSRSALPDLHL